MQAVGIYSGVPQDEHPLPQNPPRKHYLPTSIKTVTLLGFCVVTASAIGALQWTAAPGNQHHSGDLQPRDDAPTFKHYPRATTSLSADMTPAPITSAPGAILTATTTSDEDDVTASTDPDAFVPISPTTTRVAGTTVTDAFIPLDPTSAESTATSAFVPLQPTPSIGESTATSAFVPMDPTQTVAATTASDAFVPLGPSGTPVTTPTAGTFVITTNVPGGTSLVAATITGTLDPSQPLLFTATGSGIPGGTLVVTKTGPLLAGPTSTWAQDPSAGKTDSADGALDGVPADSFGARPAGFTIANYFMGAYLPTLLAVIYGILWSTILAGIAEMTPFFQLTRQGGATVKESLLLEYRNAGLWDLLVSSITHRNGLVFAGTVVSLIVTATIALASGVFYIGISGTCRETGRGADCIRYLGVNRRLAWAECGMLVVVLGIMAFVIFSLRKKNSGLFAEATSIAGVATLMSNPHVVARMREALEKEKDGRESSEVRFGLGRSYDEAVGWTHGFTVVDGAKHEKDATAITPMFEEDEATQGADESSSVLPLLLRPAMLVVFTLVLLGLLAILLYYWFNGSSSPLEDFLNSQTFGPKLMMSCFGIVIRTWWSEIARAIHAMQPYRALALGRATARSSLLAPTSTHAVPAIATALRRRHFFAAWLALLAVLSEVLIVTLAAVPFNLATLLGAFRISVFVSVGIVGLMVATLPFVLVWCRSAVVGPPACVGDAVAGLMDEGNEVVGAVAGMGALGRGERDRAVEGLGRRYRLVGEGGGGGEAAGGMRVALERYEWVA